MLMIQDRERERKIVFYGRVSTEHEAQLSALENQLQWYDDQLKYHPNWELQRKYIDEGITGTQAKKRPAFMQMMADARKGKFDLIVTREVCRFARNTVDTLVATRELKNLGIEVYFVSDNIWTMDGDGELRLTIMATLAQDESRKISERVLAGQQVSREKGVLYGNGNILGYDRVDGTYKINEAQAETVRRIYDLYQAGNGMCRIRRILTEEGRKDARGLVNWDMSKISRVLHNATYMGYKCYLKSRRNNFLDQKIIRNRDEDTHMLVKGDFEPIISEEQWKACREIRESKTAKKTLGHGKGVKKYGVQLSKDVWANKMRCSCGGKYRKDKWHRTAEGDYIYGYKCYRQLNKGGKRMRVAAGQNADGYCDAPTIPDWKVDLMFKTVFEDFEIDKKAVIEKAYQIYEKLVNSKKSTASNKTAEYEQKIQAIEYKIDNVLTMRVEGEITKEEYARIKQKYEAEITSLKQLIVKENEISPQETGKPLSFEELQNSLTEIMDMSKDKVDKGVAEKFVSLVQAGENNIFRWVLSLSPSRNVERKIQIEGRKSNVRVELLKGEQMAKVSGDEADFFNVSPTGCAQDRQTSATRESNKAVFTRL